MIRHRPTVRGYVAASVVVGLLATVGIFLALGADLNSWALTIAIFALVPALALSGVVMAVTHLLTAKVVPQWLQVLVAAGCGAVAGLLAPAVGGPVLALVGAVAAAAGRAVAVAFTGPPERRRSWESRLFP